jgi:hypothetical protein
MLCEMCGQREATQSVLGYGMCYACATVVHARFSLVLRKLIGPRLSFEAWLGAGAKEKPQAAPDAEAPLTASMKVKAAPK